MAASIRTGMLARRIFAAPAAARLLPLTTAPLQRTGVRFQHQNAGKHEQAGGRPFSNFDLTGKVFVVTGAGGGRGLGLCMAEGLAEAGGKVYCVDRLPSPVDDSFAIAQDRIKAEFGGSLEYGQVDVTNSDQLDTFMADIASEKQRLDGLIAAAAIQQVTPALDYHSDDIARMLAVNYTGVFLSARACARQMLKYKIRGSMCLVASMSGIIANRGFMAPVYNSSKAAVIQLGKNLSMEWGRVQEDGSGGIRVNCLSPGHILTPMVARNFEAGEADRAEWENNNMLGRISTPEEYKAAGLFLLSNASSYMTGNNLVIDGGTTAW